MNTINRSSFDAISQFCKSLVVYCEDKTAASIFVVIGFLVTLWANCLLVISYSYTTFLHEPIYNEDVIIRAGTSIFYTLELIYYIITFTAITFFISGIKQNSRGLLIPWLILKLTEFIILFCSCLIVLYFGNPYNVILIPFGILFFSVGLYIYVCVLRTYYGYMPQTNVGITEDPPSYDSAILIVP